MPQPQHRFSQNPLDVLRTLRHLVGQAGGRFAEADRIPLELRPKGGEVSRCCIYKDRAILKYRCMASLGFAPEDETDELTSLKGYGERALERTEHAVNKLSVITDACSGCIRSRYLVTDACRGCFAQPCQVNCPKQAITILGKQVFQQCKFDNYKH